MHVFLISPRIIRPEGKADLRQKKKRMMVMGAMRETRYLQPVQFNLKHTILYKKVWSRLKKAYLNQYS